MPGYLTLLLSDFFFKTDYCFLVFAIKPLNRLQLRIALPYLVPFAVYILILNVVVFAQLRRE